MSTPPEPLPSSTVILLREERAGDGPFSVLMLERHGSITFPGVQPRTQREEVARQRAGDRLPVPGREQDAHLLEELADGRDPV
ncbi:MAG: hypothetical protein ACREQL_07605, partial [Candidatus Binatia bacterium]